MVTVNGQTFKGPLYVTRKGVLKGFAFVSHGADDNTTASIAASAAHTETRNMDQKLKTWIEAMGFDADNLTDDQLAGLTANYNGKNHTPAPKPIVAGSPFEEAKIEAKRRTEIREISDKYAALRPGDFEHIVAIEKQHDYAIETKMGVQEFRLQMAEAAMPQGHTVYAPRPHEKQLTNRVLEAALCTSGGLRDLDKHFTDQELQAAHSQFRHGISLNEFLIVAAKQNGYRDHTGVQVTREIHNAAFGLNSHPSMIRGGAGFSVIDVANIVSATANKFLHEGWMAVDMTPLKIANVRSVKNFQAITTVSLTGHLQFEKIGADGELKHGTLDELTYTNQADTYGQMLAITRKDLINDDLGALSAAPRRLGRGGALKLNDIFWAEFLGLVSANFFHTSNNNINTGVADMSIGGLEATETTFMSQTDPDGKPLGLMPKIVLVPTALKAKAAALINSQGSVLITGASATIPDANVFQGRFRVESSPYIHNTSYTGSTATGWWMLADPNEAAVIEIAALNGKVEPTVETADANFNVLGVQMRGYSDIGVNEQEKRAGVYADGTT